MSKRNSSGISTTAELIQPIWCIIEGWSEVTGCEEEVKTIFRKKQDVNFKGC